MVIAGLFISLAIFPVFAEEHEERPTSEQREEMAQERQAEREVAREEKRAALSEERVERLNGLWDRMEGRLLGAVERFSQILDRFDAKFIELAEKHDGDASEAQAHLAAAREDLEAASAAIIDAKAAFMSLLDSDTPRSELGGVRQHITGVITSLRAARDDMHLALGVLKDIASSVRENAGNQGEDV